MAEKMILSRQRIAELLAYLDQQIGRDGCDHTRRWTLEWAQEHGADREDLSDALDDRSVFCDCEVLMNLEAEADLVQVTDDAPTPPANPWCLPPEFQAPPSDRVFTKVLRAVNREGANCYSADGSLVVPAPKGAKPRRRVRKSVHFFVGLSDGLPNEVGFVGLVNGITAPALAKQVRDSGLPELSAFSEREAAYFLSRLENLPVDTPVGIHFTAVTGVSAREQDQIRIHKVVLRR